MFEPMAQVGGWVKLYNISEVVSLTSILKIEGHDDNRGYDNLGIPVTADFGCRFATELLIIHTRELRALI